MGFGPPSLFELEEVVVVGAILNGLGSSSNWTLRL